MGSLSRHFSGVAAKYLTVVETDPERSHQHEFQGIKSLRKLLGEQKKPKTYDTEFLYLTDDPDDIERANGFLTWSDVRRDDPNRSAEYHLYYSNSAVTENLKAGDLAVFCKKKDGNLMFIAAEKDSASAQQLKVLFGLDEKLLQKEEYKDVSEDTRPSSFAEKLILEILGIQAIRPADEFLNEMLSRFDNKLPTTGEFSSFAREKSGNTEGKTSDEILVTWISREEELFRSFERHIVSKRLKKGFGEDNSDVDAFVDFSLSVHNRRKSRMGKALENHLEFLFESVRLKFKRNGKTEQKKRPDFLFPGESQYKSENFPAEKLIMLGAKSTCKDRWRQVLSEASRIKNKHLFTLEPGISTAQTEEMKEALLQLVVPQEIQNTYTSAQKNWLMSLEEFIAFAKEKQR